MADSDASSSSGAAAIRRLRLVGFLEGVSYLVLLGIAMPLKYAAGMPLAVRIVGTAHGGLFILFFAAVVDVARRRRIPQQALWMRAVLASVVPFGTFVFDGWLKKFEASEEREVAELARVQS